MDSRTSTYRPPRQIQRGARPPPGASRGGMTTPKRVIWTLAFAAVAAVSTIYGAGLKTQQEYHEEKRQILETPVEDRIRMLEAHKAQLAGQKRPLEKKLDELRLRVRTQEAEAAKKTTTTDGRS